MFMERRLNSITVIFFLHILINVKAHGNCYLFYYYYFFLTPALFVAGVVSFFLFPSNNSIHLTYCRYQSTVPYLCST